MLQLIESPETPGGILWDSLQKIYSFIGIPLNFSTLLCLLIVLFLIGQFFLYTKKKKQVIIQTSIIKDIKVQIFKNSLGGDISYHHNRNSSQFINAILTESEITGSGVFSLAELITDILFIITYAFLLLYLSVEMTLICVVISVITMFSLNFFLKKSTEYGKKLQGNNITLNDFVIERFSLLRLIKSSSTEDLECEKISAITKKFQEDARNYAVVGVRIETVFQIIIFVLAIVVLYISIIFLKMPLPSLLVFLFILVRITTPLRDFSNRRHEMARYFHSAHNIDDILNDLASSHKISNGDKQFKGFEKNIHLSHLNFSYTPENPVIQDISVTIRKNEFIAFVGASGGGKSTLIDIITRLIDPDHGEVTIDGTILKDYDLRSYHSKIGLVSQESLIFNDSVINNICYGSEHCSLENAINAARVAYAHDFIEKLPEGYNSFLGERGVKLSGGQKQRIALARAIYKNPEILILDEATSSLDTESEKIIQNAITNIKEHYTIIAIAHRLSTIENADRILILENGKIVEEGTHEQLRDKNGHYAKYYKMQHSNNKNDFLK